MGWSASYQEGRWSGSPAGPPGDPWGHRGTPPGGVWKMAKFSQNGPPDPPKTPILGVWGVQKGPIASK